MKPTLWTQPDLWGVTTTVGRGGLDGYREPVPLAEALRIELQRTAEIQADPFRHLPAALRGLTLTQIVSKQRRTRWCWLDASSQRYHRTWGANGRPVAA